MVVHLNRVEIGIGSCDHVAVISSPPKNEELRDFTILRNLLSLGVNRPMKPQTHQQAVRNQLIPSADMNRCKSDSDAYRDSLIGSSLIGAQLHPAFLSRVKLLTNLRQLFVQSHSLIGIGFGQQTIVD